MPGHATFLVALTLLLTGCTVENRSREWSDGPEVMFAEQVQPAIRRHCAFVGCHGREGMSLTLYAVDYLRMRDPDGNVDPSVPVLDERSLTPAELTHNRRAVAARVTVEDPRGELFLDRLIAPSEGGIPHASVVVFERDTDPDFEAFRRFIEEVGVE